MSFVYEGEHPELGHTIYIARGDGSAIVFADEVRFLEDGSAPTKDKNRHDLNATIQGTLDAFRESK